MQGRKERSGENLPSAPDSSVTTPNKADQGGQGEKDDTKLSKRGLVRSQAQDIEKPLYLAESVRDPLEIKLSKKLNSPINILG